MEAQDNVPSYVTCQCRQCDENIEFDANAFAEEFSAIPCPHCGQETRLFLTVKPGDPATGAQQDYIRRLGFTPPATLRFQEARDLIQELLQAARATARQLDFIRFLGGTPHPEFSRAEVEQVIAKLLAKQRNPPAGGDLPTRRQMKLLRLWDRIDLTLAPPAEVEAWLAQFYAEDPRRKAAWEKFQSEYGDDAASADLAWVPVGMGQSYLDKK
jgi:hypothetical protein